MAYRFHSDITDEGVRIAIVEKRLLGKEKHMPIADWTDVLEFRPFVRSLLELVENGSATATDTDITLSAASGPAWARGGLGRTRRDARRPPQAALD
jgi:hypothetical protein